MEDFKHACHDHCVCQQVRNIVAAQDKVAEQMNCCKVSCEQSIKDLLRPDRVRPSGKNTIPFILYCKGSCKPFIAEAIEHATIDGFCEKWYKCLKSPFLKAKKFIPGSKCCVVVELLIPCNANGMPLHEKGDNLEDFCCCETPFRTIHFCETGICLTLDLEEFSGIRCLAATRTRPC